jgi:hypothetical protein
MVLIMITFIFHNMLYYTTCNGCGHGQKFHPGGYCGNGSCAHCTKQNAMSVHVVVDGEISHRYVCSNCKVDNNYEKITQATTIGGENLAEMMGLHGVLMG